MGLVCMAESAEDVEVAGELWDAHLWWEFGGFPRHELGVLVV
jgi:hypothetical protein